MREGEAEIALSVKLFSLKSDGNYNQRCKLLKTLFYHMKSPLRL